MLPLGTGNDLARVLGWGGSCDDDTQLPQILEKLERASTKMLDRYVHLSSIYLCFVFKDWILLRNWSDGGLHCCHNIQLDLAVCVCSFASIGEFFQVEHNDV